MKFSIVLLTLLPFALGGKYVDQRNKTYVSTNFCLTKIITINISMCMVDLKLINNCTRLFSLKERALKNPKKSQKVFFAKSVKNMLLSPQARSWSASSAT